MTLYYIFEGIFKQASYSRIWAAYVNSGDINVNDVRACVLLKIPRGVRLGLVAFTKYQAMGSSGTTTFWMTIFPREYYDEVLAKHGGTSYLNTWVLDNIPGSQQVIGVPAVFQVTDYTDISSLWQAELNGDVDCLLVCCDGVGDNSGVDSISITVTGVGGRYVGTDPIVY